MTNIFICIHYSLSDMPMIPEAGDPVGKIAGLRGPAYSLSFPSRIAHCRRSLARLRAGSLR